MRRLVHVTTGAEIDFWILVRQLSTTDLEGLQEIIRRQLKLRQERIEKGMDPALVHGGAT